jgi:hypothetical protein
VPGDAALSDAAAAAMGTRFWEVVCDEHGIGGSGEYCGDIDAHLGRVNAFYHRAFGGKCGKTITKGPSTSSSDSHPCSVAAFVVNSEPHTGARPSVHLCMGTELARCVHKYYQLHRHRGNLPLWAMYLRRAGEPNVYFQSLGEASGVGALLSTWSL